MMFDNNEEKERYVESFNNKMRLIGQEAILGTERDDDGSIIITQIGYRYTTEEYDFAEYHGVNTLVIYIEGACECIRCPAIVCEDIFRAFVTKTNSKSAMNLNMGYKNGLCIRALGSVVEDISGINELLRIAIIEYDIHFISIEIPKNKIISMSGLFEAIGGTQPIFMDISKLYTGKCQYMNRMFTGMNADAIIGLREMDVSKVINMEHMFERAEMDRIDLRRWNTCNVISMGYMFNNGCINEIDMRGIKTDKLEVMDYMFSRCHGTTGLVFGVNISGIDTSRVNNMYNIFHRSSIRYLNISGWVIADTEMYRRNYFGDIPNGFDTIMIGPKRIAKSIKVIHLGDKVTDEKWYRDINRERSAADWGW